jgi:hypothetical protein
MSTNDRRAKLEEIIALNTERHNRLQEEEDFEAYYRENILQALDDIVRQVASERAPETLTATAPGQKARISTTMRGFFERFEGTYESLMEAMFPSLALSAGAMAVRGGTRSGTEDPGATGAVAPQRQAQQRPLTPEEEEVRSGLSDWVVVPYAHAPKNRPEYAILWAGEDPAPRLPPLELRLDGQPQDENVFWLREKTKNMADLPRGNVTFVQFNRVRPVAFTISEREDGGLVVDFMT